MSLYNLMFGESPNADALLALIGLTPGDVGRYRDCYLTKDGRIAVYTRNGGGNRECWGSDEDPCNCPGCVIEERLPKHPLYLSDEDDEFDCTYATIYFRLPESADRDALAAIQPEIARNDAWLSAIAALESSNKVSRG